MKRYFDRLFPAAVIGAVVLVGALASHSCANTTTPPTGGPKDTIPPVIVKVNPESGMLNVATHKPKLKFTFNEYVVVKDQKSIFLSPPQEKTPKNKISDKSVIVYFEEDLDSNRTYVLDLTNAIADNNEGNMFAGYTLVFSTGDHIDSMVVTGTVRDCNTLNPIKGATVLLYKDHADSAIFLHRPDAACKTDEWGFFAIRNIQDTLYRMYALVDENNNNLYEPDNEKIAFLDTLVKPVMMAVDTLFELGKYDMKDTVNCLARKSEYDLNIFREKPTKQMIVNKERLGERTAYITFMAQNTEIDSIWIKGIPHSKLITQFNLEKDSLEIWINDPRPQPDTLFVNLDYMKTDTLGVLVKTHEVVKLSKPRVLASAAKKTTGTKKKEDTLCVFTMDAKPEMIEQYGFVMEFKYPIVEDGFDSLGFTYINPKQQEIKGKYRVERDSLNLRKYTVWPMEKLLPGYEYKLKIPHRKFRDINGFYNDSLETKVTLPNDDKLSTLIANFTSVGGKKYIIDLLGEKKDKAIRTFIIEKDTQLTFPYITAGKYCIRITEDLNRNGLVDTGNLLEKRQPEKVKFFKLADGNEFLDIPEMTELEQAIDLGELFK